jgi:hypothetical protein
MGEVPPHGRNSVGPTGLGRSNAMTLLLKLSPTRRTAIFSGDKRLTNADGSGFEEFHEKVTPLSQFAVGGACGRTRGKHKQSGEELYSVQRLAREFFADKAMDKDNMEVFRYQLQSQLLTYQMEYGVVEPEREDGYVFSFAASSLKGHLVSDSILTCRVPDAMNVAISGKTYPCNIGTLLLFGDLEITTALKSLNHPALEELCAHPDIRQLLDKPIADRFDIVTVDRAIEVCRLITCVCSERFEEIVKRQSTISPECDVFLLDQEGVRKV